jgi:hypothetical protein
MVARVLEVEENDRKAVRAEAGESDENENVRGVPDGRGPVHEEKKIELWAMGFDWFKEVEYQSLAPASEAVGRGGVKRRRAREAPTSA